MDKELIERARAMGASSDPSAQAHARCIRDLLGEIDQMNDKVERTRQWYGERWQGLQNWFRTTGKDLPIPNQFWSIIANGKPDHNAPTWQQQLNTALHRAEAAEAKL